MIALAIFICSLLLVSTSTLASPLVPVQPGQFFNPSGLLCNLPIVNKILCPRQDGTLGLSVKTPLGVARGVSDASGAMRFSVKYAAAQRWAASSMAKTWQLPNGASNPSALPLVCPQDNVKPSTMSEDCLSMILYVPKSVKVGSGAPVMVWVHGGSFIVGSATDAGLDGSKLASATGAIVAVIQYRLGALGFLGPDGSTNLGLADFMLALQFLQKVGPSFGGSSSKIAVAGQSSGATLIRALLAVPSASSLFQSAILQSDPMDYGFLAPSVQQKMQSAFNSDIDCKGTDKSCLNRLSLNKILSAQDNIYNNAASQIDPSTGTGEPIRVVRDGKLITSPLDSTAPFPHESKPLLITNVLDEAAAAIYSAFPDTVPEDQFEGCVNASFGSPRTQQIVSSPHYSLSAGVDRATADARVQLQQLATDYLWKCAAWTFGRNWASNGGNVFMGMYVVGATYPGNDEILYCTSPGVVCHQDDIEIGFGTVPNPTPAQSQLTTEMQARYKAFLNTGNPNPQGSSFATWAPATNSDVHALTLGGLGEVAVGACDPNFWGEAVQYDYQVYDI